MRTGGRFRIAPGPARRGGAAAALALVVGRPVRHAAGIPLPGLRREEPGLAPQAGRADAQDSFASLAAGLEAREARFAGTALPAEPADFYPLFRDAGLDPGNEGIALANGDGFVEVWYGNVLSLSDQIADRRTSSG